MFIINFEHVSHIVLVFSMLTFNNQTPGIYIIDLSPQGCYYKVLVVSEEMLRSENRIAGLRAIYALNICFLNAPLT